MELEIVALVRLLVALAAGAAIGIERSYHGRPAGFRTHALVCISSALLMLVTVYQWVWFAHPAPDSVRIDPTRMAQGIVTGIGFLGGGVIFKEGLTVRGLTTAASIWVTSAIGILIGVGMYLPALTATLLVLAVLTVFRQIELRLPSSHFALHTIRFARGDVLPEEDLRALLGAHGFGIANMSYSVVGDGQWFEYRMALRTTRDENIGRLARTLSALPSVHEFAISPSGD